MKPRYEKPVIIKLQTGFMNKFGSSPLYTRKIRTEIDGVPIADLVEQFGSPLYVFSEKAENDLIEIYRYGFLNHGKRQAELYQQSSPALNTRPQPAISAATRVTGFTTIPFPGGVVMTTSSTPAALAGMTVIKTVLG